MWRSEYCVVCMRKLILMVFQAGVTSKWTNDGLRFLLEHFDTIKNCPSQIYHSALPLSPPSWLHKCYSAELSPMVTVIKGLPVEWGVCSRTLSLDISTSPTSYHNNSIAVGSRSGDIIILDTIAGTQKAVFSGHRGEIRCVAFSLDGISLVSGGADRTVKLWDVQTGGVVNTFSGHTDWVSSVSISADYTTVASGSDDGTLCLWDIRTGGCRHTIEQQDAEHVVFSPTDPQHLMSVSDEKVLQWNANGYQTKPPFDGHYVSFSPDGAQFALCHGNTVTVHDSSSGVTVSEFQTAESYDVMCWLSPDSRLAVVASNRIIYCWNIANSKPQLIETFTGHIGSITSLVFSSPTTLISAAMDNSVKFWQIGAQSIDSAVIDPKYTSPHSAQIMSITLQTKDGIVITSDIIGVVNTWDISTGIQKGSIQTPARGDKWDYQLINDRLISVFYTSSKIHVWDVENEKQLLEIDGIHTSLNDIKISGDGSTIFHLHDSSIWARSIQTRTVVGSVEIGQKGEGSLIVDGSKVWAYWRESDYEGWDFGASGSTPTKLAGMPTLCNGSIFWDPRRGRIKNTVTGVIFQLTGRFKNPHCVQCDGSYLVAGYISGEILILELKHAPL